MDKINLHNSIISTKLENIKCRVPSLADLSQHNDHYEQYKNITSTKYKPDRTLREDPLITFQKNFSIATSTRNNLELQRSSFRRSILDVNLTSETFAAIPELEATVFNTVSTNNNLNPFVGKGDDIGE